MKPIPYSIEDTIHDFFTCHPTVTQQQCDKLAVSLVGGPVSPVPIQGSFSYTVTAGAQQSKIVQFRDVDSDLDTNFLDLARQVHGQVVASYTFHGKIGRLQPLSVYSMEKLPGIPYISAQSRYPKPEGTLLDIGSQHSNTVADYAMYVEPLVPLRTLLILGLASLRHRGRKGNIWPRKIPEPSGGSIS